MTRYKHRTLNKCDGCGIGLSKTYTDFLCPSCRREQDKKDKDARLAAGISAMIQCITCFAAFWTPEGLESHPCIGYYPDEDAAGIPGGVEYFKSSNH